MPDVREVYEMVTKQKPPEPGALERQQRRQVRTARNRKLGALAVAATIGLVALALIWTSQTGDPTSTPAGDPSTPLGLPSPPTPSDAEAAERLAMDFLVAYANFDAQEAMRYVADGADLSQLIEQVPADADGLALWLSFLEGQGFEQMVTSCVEEPFGSDMRVVCDFDFHLIRSQDLGRGPFGGSTYGFIVRDGEIIRADLTWEIEEFSPQMWEPFERWVYATHPKDWRVMYNDDGNNFELTEASARLWELNSERYVEAVLAGEAE
jgi:hypothetical protein